MIAFFLIASIIGGGIILLLYRLFGGDEAKKIDWNEMLHYPQGFGIAAVLTLLGYQIGLYSYVFLEIPSTAMRFPVFGWVIFAVCLSVMWLVLLWQRKNIFVFSIILTILLSGIMMPLRANGFLQSVNVAMTTISSLILLYILTRTYPEWQLSTMIKEIILFIPLTIIQIVRFLRSFLRRDAERHQNIVGWFKTALIALVVLFFFIVILSNADPIFSEVVSEFRTQLFGRAFAAVLIFLITASVLTIKREPQEKSQNHFGLISFRDISVATLSVTIVLLVFLFIQFKYLFGGSRDLLMSLHMTYSEYVRKGFIELLIAAFVGGWISYILTLKNRMTEENSLKTIATIANVILLIELMLLLVSAFKRDLLYVDTYGLTRVRVIGGLFLFWLSGFLLVLGAFSLKKNMKEVRILGTMWVLTLGVWIILNATNIDRKVVMGAPGHHEYTDYFYLFQLSEDASSEWNGLIPKIKQDTETLLSKDELTDVDKSQFAGLKLALLTIAEKRDRLYRSYAPEEWILRNGWKIGDQLEMLEGTNGTRMLNESYSAFYSDYLVDSVYATNWRNPKEKRGLSKNYRKMRQTAFLNIAEKQAFDRISQNEPMFFDEVNEMIRTIRAYQLTHQISLQKEESRLLYDFKYPFLSVKLDRYHPDNLIRSYDSDPKRAGQKVFLDLESKQEWSISRLQTTKCSDVPQSFEIYGALYGEMANQLQSADPNSRIFAFMPLNANDTSIVTLVVPPRVKIERVDLSKDPMAVNGGIQTAPVQYDNYSYNNSTKIFLKVKGSPVAQGSVCAVQAEKLTEMFELGGQ